jgi:hypothetical protein
MDGRKLTFEKYYIGHRGQGALDRLWEMARDIELGKSIRQTGGKGAIAKFYKNQYDIMIERRYSGFVGRLEFEAWQP